MKFCIVSFNKMRRDTPVLVKVRRNVTVTLHEDLRSIHKGERSNYGEHFEIPMPNKTNFPQNR
jgi:hypothetical protein